MDEFGQKALDVGAGLATGLLNKGIDSMFAGASTRRSINANKELMSYQQSLQRSANLRAMSDKRHSLERAGINLNAENGFQPVQAVPISGISSPKAEGGFDMSSLGSLAQYQLQNEQAKNLERQNRLFDSTFEEQVNRVIQDTRNATNQAEISAIIASNQQRIINADISEKDANAGLAFEQTALAAATTNKMSVEVQKLEKEIDEILSRTDLNFALKKKAIADSALSYASAKYQKSLALFTDKQREKYDSYIQSVIDANDAGKLKSMADAGLSTWNIVKIFADLPFYAGKMSKERFDDFCDNLGIPEELRNEAWNSAYRAHRYRTTATGEHATPVKTGE